MSWGRHGIWSCAHPIKTVVRVLVVHEEPHANPFSLNTFSGDYCHDE